MFTEISCDVISFLLFPKNIWYNFCEVNAVVIYLVSNLYNPVFVSKRKHRFISESMRKEMTRKKR